MVNRAFLVDEMGLDVSKVDYLGFAPIHYAIGKRDNIPVLRILLEWRVDPLKLDC